MGALAVGVLLGIIIELAIEARQISDLMDDYHRLELENEMLRKEIPTAKVIEIIDNTVAKSANYFEPF